MSKNGSHSLDDALKSSTEEPEKESFDQETIEEPDAECPETISAKDQKLDLFRMVFDASQKIDEDSKKNQKRLATVLTVVLCIQVIWALWFISKIVLNSTTIPNNVLTFATLLVTAILGEVVGMAFFVVKFVFRNPIDVMIELLKEILNK